MEEEKQMWMMKRGEEISNTQRIMKNYANTRCDSASLSLAFPPNLAYIPHLESGCSLMLPMYFQQGESKMYPESSGAE